MEGFKSYSGYKVGVSHIAKNMGCEDYAATYDKSCLISVTMRLYTDQRSI